MCIRDRAHDLTENYRDVLMNIQDLYISNVNLKMNQVMKVMAIVTCLLAPPTVIVGIFGMNFDVIPFAHTHVGFYLTVFMTLIIPAITVSYTHLRAHETPEHLVCRLLLE